MRLYIVLFACGAWLLQQQAELPDLRYAWLLLLALPAAWFAAAAGRISRYAGRGALALAWLAAGFYWAAALAHVRMGESLAPEWEGRDIEVIGVVATLPQPYERSVR